MKILSQKNVNGGIEFIVEKSVQSRDLYSDYIKYTLRTETYRIFVKEQVLLRYDHIADITTFPGELIMNFVEEKYRSLRIDNAEIAPNQTGLVVIDNLLIKRDVKTWEILVPSFEQILDTKNPDAHETDTLLIEEGLWVDQDGNKGPISYM